MSFNRFILEAQYKKVKGLGDRLALMKQQINWKPFIPLVKSVFYDDKKQGGRPHTDELDGIRTRVAGSKGRSDDSNAFTNYYVIFHRILQVRIQKGEDILYTNQY